AAPAETDGNGRVKASPIARRMARDLNVELAQIEGSGPGGRIVKADVEAAAPPPEGAKGEVEVVELNRLQQTVARRMAESKATVPHFYLSTEIDMSESVHVRAELKELAGDAP